MVRIVFGVAMLCYAWVATESPSFAAVKVGYKVAAAGQLVAADGQVVLLRQVDALAAHAPGDGRLLWTAKIAALVVGENTIALCGARIYALTATGLMIVDRDSGKVRSARAFEHPTAVLCTSSSVMVSHAKGVSRLDAAAKHVENSAPTRGRLLAADGKRVILVRQLKISGSTSPKRLTVVDLGTKKVVYEFKLLRGGAHRLLRATGGILAILDYSTATTLKRGKLYFTRADYRAGKKLSDVSLANHYPKGGVDGFEGVVLDDGRLFVASKGDASAEHMALLYQRKSNKIGWKRKLPAGAAALQRQGDVLWIALRSKGGELLALDLKDGHTRQRIALDGFPQQARVAPSGVLYAKTPSSLWRITPVGLVVKGKGKSDRRLYRDTLAGYTFYLPHSWRLAAKRIRHYAKGSFSVPFVRYRQEGERWIFLASVHVLVRPAANQTVEALADSVLQQWRRRMGKAKLHKTRRWMRDGKTFLLNSYRFQNRYRREETSFSLCVVSHGFAFELRARTSAEGGAIWPEIIEALESFRPRPELVGATKKSGPASKPD